MSFKSHIKDGHSKADLFINFANIQIEPHPDRNMINPSYLKKGDCVGIVAPAGKVSREQIMPAMDMLHSWGLEIELGKNLFKEYHSFSGTDAERASDLQQMLDNPSIKAIFSARGGYGTLRILDRLDFSLFCKRPKWIIGYSDITVLHSHIHSKLGIQTVHGAMPVNFPKNKEATESLFKTLFNDTPSHLPDPHPLNKPGQGEGLLTGGNLSLLSALIGSHSDIDTRGKILFIEDLDEYLYHIDRMMMSLKRSGKLNDLSALLVGGMTEMKDNTVPFGKTAEEIILEAVSGFDYPVCFNFPAGHIEKNLALVFGRKARLSVSEKKVSFSQTSDTP
jgi:muramoyltetrapeptide carboxypeptidase